jgi:DNA/RNA endonuclease YhcR with UshA esterase domain
MRKFYAALAVVLCLGLISGISFGQGTYTWNRTTTGGWSIDTNWTPARTTPSAGDTLVFNNGGTDTVTAVPRQTIAQLLVLGNTTVNISATAVNKLTIVGATIGLSVDAGSSLNLFGASADTLFLGAGAKANISGSMTFSGGNHKLNAADAGAITFSSGAVFTQGSGCTGNVFTADTSTTTSSTVVFSSGSVFVSQAGSNPFALTAPRSKVTFQTGSLFRHEQTGLPSFSGRTYANFELNAVASLSSVGSGALSIDTIKISKGRLNLGLTGTFNLRGSIIVGAGDTLTFNPASAATITFSGSNPQVVSGDGVLTFLSRAKINVNGAGIVLNRDVAVDTVTFTSGAITLGNFKFTTAGVVSGAAASKCFITNGTGGVVRTIGAGGSFLFPVAADASTYNPLSLSLGATDPSESFTVNVASGVTPSLPVNADAVQATWTVTEGTPGGNNATIGVQWTGAQEGASFTRSTAAAWQYQNNAWGQSSGGVTSGSDPYQFTSGTPITSFAPLVIANGHPVSAYSTKAISFGNVNAGLSKTDSVTVSNVGAAPLQISSVVASDTLFKVTPQTGSVNAGDSLKFYVTFSPLVSGLSTASIVFSSNTTGGLDTVRVSGTGVQAGFLAVPSVLTYGSVEVGKSKVDTVEVTNVSSAVQLVIDSVRVDNAVFTVAPTSSTIAPSSTQPFEVTFHPATKGAASGKVVFFHNGPTLRDTIKVSGSGFVREPVIVITPSSLNLGRVLAGSSATDTLRVRNSGNDSLFVTSTTSSDTEFVVTPKSARIDTGATAIFTVKFTPAGVGARSANLVFANNSALPLDTVKATGIADVVLPIGTARLDSGLVVTVEGIVTRTAGAFTRIQDTTGAIVVYATAGTSSWYDSVASGYIRKGDRVRITSTVSVFRGLVELSRTDIASFTRLSRNNPVPLPKLLTLAEIAANGEKYESQLIRVDNVTISGTGTFAAATTYNITDASDQSGAVALRTGNAGDTRIIGLRIPSAPANIICVLGQFTSTSPTIGYQLQPIDSTDVISTVDVATETGIPDHFALENNYPNPFNPSTTIQYALPKQSRVTVKIYTILGTEVTTLVDEIQEAKFYRIAWRGTNNSGMAVASGVYFYRLSAEPLEKGGSPFTLVKKMIMMK